MCHPGSMDGTDRAILGMMLIALGLTCGVTGLVVWAAQLSKRARVSEREDVGNHPGSLGESGPSVGLGPWWPGAPILAGLGFLVAVVGGRAPFPLSPPARHAPLFSSG